MGTEETLRMLKKRHRLMQKQRAFRDRTYLIPIGAKKKRKPRSPEERLRVKTNTQNMRARRLANGQCAFCENKRETFSYLCDACTEKHRNIQRARRQREKEAKSALVAGLHPGGEDPVRVNSAGASGL